MRKPKSSQAEKLRSRKIDKLTDWQDARLTRWQKDRMTRCKDDNMTRWHHYRTIKQQDDKSYKKLSKMAKSPKVGKHCQTLLKIVESCQMLPTSIKSWQKKLNIANIVKSCHLLVEVYTVHGLSHCCYGNLFPCVIRRIIILMRRREYRLLRTWLDLGSQERSSTGKIIFLSNLLFADKFCLKRFPHFVHSSWRAMILNTTLCEI